MELVIGHEDLVHCRIKNDGPDEAHVVTYLQVGSDGFRPIYGRTAIPVKPGETIDALVCRSK